MTPSPAQPRSNSSSDMSSSSSNKLLDLLAGASARVTSPPSTPAAADGIDSTRPPPTSTASSSNRQSTPTPSYTFNQSTTPTYSNHVRTPTAKSIDPFLAYQSLLASTSPVQSQTTTSTATTPSYSGHSSLPSFSFSFTSAPSDRSSSSRKDPADMPASSASSSSSSNTDRKQQNVSGLMQQFMGGGPSLVAMSPEQKASKSSKALSTSPQSKKTQPDPAVLHNKTIQLPPSPPSSVSSVSGSRPQPSEERNGAQSNLPPPPSASTPSSASAPTSAANPAPSAQENKSNSTKPAENLTAPTVPAQTPFDFVSPFDVLSSRREAPAQPSASSLPQVDSSVPEQQDGLVSPGYERAIDGINNFLHKLQKPTTDQAPAQQSPAIVESKPAVARSIASNGDQEASKTSVETEAPQIEHKAEDVPDSLAMPAALNAPDKQYHASRHVTVLHRDDSFQDPKTSGLSILSPSRSSNAPRIATLDLGSQQPGGLSSLSAAKVETSGVALISSPFQFNCSVSACGLLPAFRLASFGSSVACYSMSKGKVRLIHVQTGARLLVQAPHKAPIRSITAFQHPNADSSTPHPFLLAALTERTKETEESVIVWTVPASFVLDGSQNEQPVALGRILAEHKNPFVYRFTGMCWHPIEPKLAISTSDSNVMVVDVAKQMFDEQTPSKTMLSLQESEVDPRSKAMSHNEPLSGYAFSPDGTMMATISAPPGEKTSWSLRLKSIEQEAFESDQHQTDLVFKLDSPLNEPLFISHLSFLGECPGTSRGQEQGAQRGIRGVLVGFHFNTILGLYDLATSTWKHVWKFAQPADTSSAQEHFNLINFDHQSNTLLVSNSFRSSVFAIQLDFEDLPEVPENLLDKTEGKAGKSGLRDHVLLSLRLKHNLLPWTVSPSLLSREYALQDPCTSVSVAMPDPSSPAPEIRLFVTFPEGVSLVQLPLSLPKNETKKTNRSSEAEVIDLTGEETAERREAEVTTDAVDSAADENMPVKMNKKKKKKQSKKKAAHDGHDTGEGIDPAAIVENLKSTALNVTEVIAGPGALAADSEDDGPVRKSDEEPSEKPEGDSAAERPISQAPDAQEEKAPVPNGISHVQEPIHVSSAEIAAALSQTVAMAVETVVTDKIASGFQKSIEKSIPKEVQKLVSSTALKDQLSANIAQTILPAVQQTAVEVVGNVLAPHFEGVMLQVSERVEKALVLQILGARQELLQGQKMSLDYTDQAVQQIQQQVHEMLEKVNAMSASSRQAKIEEVGKEEALTSTEPTKPTENHTPEEPKMNIGVPAAAASTAGSAIPSADAKRPKEVARTKSSAKVETAKETPTEPAAKSASKNTGAASVPLQPCKCKLPEKVAVIGAGPVGCLAALAFAQRGCKVDIYESRPDPRSHEAVARASQRSINLALSTRGLTGLKSVSLVGLGPSASSGQDLADLVLAESVPMRARMIHTVSQKATNGKPAITRQDSQLYSNQGECINSVDRGRLNNIVLDHALKHPNVSAHFEHRLQSVDFDYDSRSDRSNGRQAIESGDEAHRQKKNKSKADKPSPADKVRIDFNVYSNNQNKAKQSVTRYASFVIGCDGAHSSIRSAMGSMVRMRYTHDYIDSGYVELNIPSRTSLGSGSRIRGDGGVDGKKGGHDAFHLDPNHLHIWPRKSFMLIALPNMDGSFTCTLFAPFKVFSDNLSSKEGIVAFFQEYFPDALPLIGEDKLVEHLTSRRPSPLGSVKCDPYNYKDRAVLIGDAAHAMLPFYGQGLNCGFEDVRVLMEKVDGSEQLESALETYTSTRHEDLLAICQLAERNYNEMASSVVDWSYLMRKRLDTVLMTILPSWMWKSLYTMVSFSNLPYAQVIRREQRQQNIVTGTLISFALTSTTAALVGIYRTQNIWKPAITRWIDQIQKKL